MFVRAVAMSQQLPYIDLHWGKLVLDMMECMRSVGRPKAIALPGLWRIMQHSQSWPT